MSIQETKSVPNVYKTEKFVIIDTIDTYGNDKLHSTKPNLLECVKIYTAFDDVGNIKEFIDTKRTYKIAVPLNLWQVDPSAAGTVDQGANSLICPPYICSNIKMLSAKATLSLQIRKRNLHRGSIIYATKRDSGIDVFGHEARAGIYVTENVDYIDINVDGRSLKISSQSNKSNNVDLTDGQTANLKNIYDGDYAGRNGGIQNLMNACVINEDAGIDYITELDQVAKVWRHTAAGAGSDADHAAPLSSTTQYALIFDHDAGSDGHYPVLKFQKVTGGGGGGSSTFEGLSDTPASFADSAKKLVQVNSDVDGLEFTHLNTKNVENVTTGNTSYFLVAQNAASGGTATSMQLRKFESLLGSDNGYDNRISNFDNFSSTDDNDAGLAILTTNGTESKFRSLKYATQLGGVRVSTTIKTAVNAQADDGSYSTSRKALATISHGTDTHPKIIFDPIGNLITNSQTEEGTDVVIGGGSNVIDSYFVVKNGTDGLEGAKLGDALYAGGVGSVKWDGNNMVLGVNTSHTDPLEGDALKLRYEPKLFGICKENGDYEYRYFLTSVPVTT